MANRRGTEPTYQWPSDWGQVSWCQTDANLDKNEQLKYGETAEITTPNSRTKVYVAPTDEELLIARDTVRVITGEMHA
jgi:acetate kinase